MSNIIPFSFQDTQVRTLLINNQPWFIAIDVCAILNLKNTSKAICALDDDERSNFKLGRQGEVNIINESGLYALIMRSRKPEAKMFRKWVTNEVLPSIRKTGSYSAASLGTNKFIVEIAKDGSIKTEPFPDGYIPIQVEELYHLLYQTASNLTMFASQNGIACAVQRKNKFTKGDPVNWLNHPTENAHNVIGDKYKTAFE